MEQNEKCIHVWFLSTRAFIPVPHNILYFITTGRKCHSKKSDFNWVCLGHWEKILLFYSTAVSLIEQRFNCPWHAGSTHCRTTEPTSMLPSWTTWIKMRGRQLLAKYLLEARCENRITCGRTVIENNCWECQPVWKPPYSESAQNRNCVCSFTYSWLLKILLWSHQNACFEVHNLLAWIY